MPNFEAVGVRAVVEGASKFVQDLSSMRNAVLQFTQTATGYATAANQQTRGADAARRAAVALTSATTNTATATQGLAVATTKSRGSMQNYAVLMGTTKQQVEQLGEKLAFLRLKNIENLNATTRAIAGSSRLSNSLVELTAKKAALEDQLGQLVTKYKSVASEQNKLNTANERNVNSTQKVSNNIQTLGDKIVVNNQKIVSATTKVEALQAELDQLGAKTSENAPKFLKLQSRVEAATAAKLDLTIKTERLAEQQEAEQNKLSELQADYRANAAEAANLGRQMDVLQNEAAGVAQEIGKIDDKIGSITRLGAALGALQQAFSKVAAASRRLATALLLPQTAFKSLMNQVHLLNARAARLGNNMFKMGNSVRFFGMSLLFLVTIPIIGFLTGVTKAAIDFEEAFAGVIKTVDGLVQKGTLDTLNERGEALRANFRKMALVIPISAAELADLGQIAGQLGVRGVSNISNFVDTIARVGSSTNIASEEAARMLAQIIAITGPMDRAEAEMSGLSSAQFDAASSSDLFAAQIQSVGSSIVNLGNKLPTTEDHIARFASRIAAAGGLARFTTADIFGIAAAFSSVGIPAERGGTAVQRTIVKMLEAVQVGGDGLELFAKVAGESAESFSSAFAEGGERAGDVFNQFVTGLGQSADQAILILDELDLADQRVLNSLLSLANAADQAGNANNRLNESLAIARDGFKKNGETLDEYNALQLESERGFATTQSQLILMKNQFTDLGITIGNVVLPHLRTFIEYVRAAARRMEEFASTQGGQIFVKVALAVAGLTAVLGPAVIALGLFMSSIGFIVIIVTKVIAAITLIGSTLGLLLFPITAVVLALSGLAIAFIASLDRIVDTVEGGASTIAGKMFRFGRGLILAFARGMAQALGAIVQVLIAIGNIIRQWLAPGSPPKIVPDLDKWGAEAMTVYLEGWLSGDFSVFNKISSKIEAFIRSIQRTVGDEELIPAILGSRKAIIDAINLVRQVGRVTEEAVNIIVRAIPNATNAVREYARALLELEEIQQRYADSLRPLEKRLEEIADRQREVAEEARRAELEEILADPRATELVRELAGLELEQIGLENQVSELESARDAELEAAQERLRIAEETLGFQIDQNRLIEEYLRMMEAASKSAKSMAGSLGGLLDDLSGFDPLGLEEGADLGDFFGDIDGAINETIESIGSEFEALVIDLQAIFAPLLDMWDELGETWAPIFQAMGGLVEQFFGFNPFADWTLPSEVNKLLESPIGRQELMFGTLPEEMPPLLTDQHFDNVRQFGEDVQGLLDGPLTGIVGFLIDIGLVEPFGQFKAQMEEMQKFGDQPFLSGFGEKVSGFIDILGGIREETINKVVELIDKVYSAFAGPPEEGGMNIGDFMSGVSEKIGEINEALSPFIGFLLQGVGVVMKFVEAGQAVAKTFLENFPIEDLKESFGEFLDQINPALERFFEAVGLGDADVGGAFEKVLGFFGTILQYLPQVIQLISGVLGGSLIQGIARGIQFILPFIGSFITAAVGFVSGFINTLKGVVQIIFGIFQAVVGALTGNTDLLKEAVETLRSGVEDLAQGILQQLHGLVSGILSILLGLGGAAIGIILGIVEGIINAFKSLAQFLPEDMRGTVTAILDIIGEFFASIIERVGNGIQKIVDWFQSLYDDLIGNSIITEMIADIIAAFTGFIPDIVEKAGEVVSGIVEAIGKLPGQLLEIGRNAIQSLGQGIKEFASDPIGSVVEAGRDILGGIAGALGIGSPSKEFRKVGESIMEGWTQGIRSNTKEVLSIFTNATEQMLEIASTLEESVPILFTSMMTKSSEAIREFTPIIINTALLFGTQFIEQFRVISEKIVGRPRQSLWNRMFELMLEVWEEFVEILLQKEGPKLSEGFTRILVEIIRVIRQQRHGFQSAGQHVMDGLRAGLEAGAAAVYETARRIADEVTRIVDDAVGNSSPSKVFMEVGENMMLGWEIGIKDNADRIASAIVDAVPPIDRIAGQRQAALASAGSRQAAPLAAGPQAAPNISTQQIQIDMGGQTIQNGIDAFQLQILVEEAVKKVL